MRYLISVVLIAVVVSSGVAKTKSSKSYQTGKLLDVEVQDITRAVALIGNIAAPIPGKLYVFKIQVSDLMYFAEYKANKHGYKPEWVVNDPIEVRFEKDSRMFLKRPDGKELEVVVTKKIRSD